MQSKLDNFRHQVYRFTSVHLKKDPMKIFDLISKSYFMEYKVLFDFESSKLQKL